MAFENVNVADIAAIQGAISEGIKDINNSKLEISKLKSKIDDSFWKAGMSTATKNKLAESIQKHIKIVGAYNIALEVCNKILIYKDLELQRKNKLIQISNLKAKIEESQVLNDDLGNIAYYEAEIEQSFSTE